MNSIQLKLNSEIFHLINEKKYEEAFKKADRLTSSFARMNWFGIIADSYIQHKSLDKAFEAAKKIPAGMERSAATLKKITDEFMLQNQVDKAIEAADSIECTGSKSRALREIGEELVKRGEAKKALMVAGMIPLESSRVGIIESASKMNQDVYRFVIRLNFGALPI